MFRVTRSRSVGASGKVLCRRRLLSRRARPGPQTRAAAAPRLWTPYSAPPPRRRLSTVLFNRLGSSSTFGVVLHPAVSAWPEPYKVRSLPLFSKLYLRALRGPAVLKNRKEKSFERACGSEWGRRGRPLATSAPGPSEGNRARGFGWGPGRGGVCRVADGAPDLPWAAAVELGGTSRRLGDRPGAASRRMGTGPLQGAAGGALGVARRQAWGARDSMTERRAGRPVEGRQGGAGRGRAG